MDLTLRKLLKSGCMLAVLDVVDAAAAAAAGLHAATATVAAPTVLLESDLVGAGVTALAACPRQVQFTTAGSTASDAPATATIKGYTKAGYTEETVTLAQTATTANSAYFWTKVSRIEFPAADGTGATIAVGFTAALGLPVKAKGRGAASAVFPIRNELVDGAAPTAGVITGPATSKPFGSYAPNSAPNGARDYLLTYEGIFPVR